MTFAWPHLLWLIALPLALLLWEGRRRLRSAGKTEHGKIIRAQAGAGRISLLGAEEAPPRRRLPRFWLAAGLALCVVALARPQWGKIEEQVFDQSREIIIALDLSRSMNATDVKPSRLERAKLLTRSLLDRLAGERVGLVVFSGTAFLQSPLSTDYEILQEFLPELQPGYLPEGGTNYDDLLKESVDAFGKTGAADRFLIVLSDGEALDEDWKNKLPLLREKNIRVIALGVGTQEGAMIPEEDGGFVKDERGAVVMSRLEPQTLQALASETKGVYRDASAWVDLPALLKETVEAGKQGAFTEKRAPRAIERFQWVLGPALFCLLASLFVEFPAPVKPRSISSVSAKAGKVAAKTAGLLVFGLGLLGLGAQRGEAADKPADKQAESPLVATVRRLADKDTLRPSDCSDLAKRTIEWGQALQSSQQPVPDGPVRDGLEAVDLGEELDAKAADWPKLRRDLEALRRRQEPPNKNDQKQEQPQQKKDQQDKQQQSQKDQPKQQDQQKQEQNKQDQNDRNSQQDKTQPPPKERKQNAQQEQNKNQDQQPPQDQEKRGDDKTSSDGQSAFGKMDSKDDRQQQQPDQQPRPQPAQDDMQKVGGVEKKQAPEMADPSLVIPLEKLEKARDKDNPGQLFQLMRDDKKSAPPSNKKNW